MQTKVHSNTNVGDHTLERRLMAVHVPTTNEVIIGLITWENNTIIMLFSPQTKTVNPKKVMSKA